MQVWENRCQGAFRGKRVKHKKNLVIFVGIRIFVNASSNSILNVSKVMKVICKILSKPVPST